MQIIKVLRGNHRNLNVVNIHLLLLDQIQQQVQRPLIHRDLYFVRRLRRGSLRLVVRTHLRVLLRHLISRRRHSFSLVAAGLSRHLPSKTRINTEGTENAEHTEKISYALAAAPPISFLFFSQPKTASRTRSIVPCATLRALFEPSSRISSTPFGFFSHFTLRSRIGAIHSIKWSAIFALHSMHPISAVRHPCAAHSSVSFVENSLCQSYTGHT